MTKEQTKEWIVSSCLASDITSPNQIRYILATVEHETAGTWKPVREAYWLSEDWRRRNLRYYPYYGRGYIQITWEWNYRKFSDYLTDYYNSEYIDLVQNPDWVMNEEIAMFILLSGMKYGLFTGYKLGDFINNKKTDFRRARKIVNGLDKAKKIAKMTKKYNVKKYVAIAKKGGFVA